MSIETKIADPSSHTKAEALIMARATECGAPIEVAANQVAQKRVHQPTGSRSSAAKQFVDTRNGQKISIGAARQIIASYEQTNDNDHPNDSWAGEDYLHYANER